MLHLFKNVYLEVDTNLDIGVDRVVVSEKYGIPVAVEMYEIMSPGAVLAQGTTLKEALAGSTLNDLFFVINERVDQFKKPVVIYVDRAAFLVVATTFFKTMLPHATAADVFKLLKSYSFKEQMFSRSRMSSNPGKPGTLGDFNVGLDEFTIEFNKASRFVSTLSTQMSNAANVEFYLASYLFDGSKKAELKRALRVLVAKDLEKYLYEIKEIILVHMQRKSLQDKLKVTKTYDFDNFYEVVNDLAPLVRVMFDPAIWSSVGMQHASSKGSINIADITDEQIALLTEYTVIVGNEWEEESFYSFVKSDISKLGFIPFFRTPEFTDAALDAIINFEVNNVHSAGSFYAIDIGTVNNYFVDHVFNAYRNKQLDALRPYTLR